MGRLGNKNAVLPVERCGCSVVCAVANEFVHKDFRRCFLKIQVVEVVKPQKVWSFGLSMWYNDG